MPTRILGVTIKTLHLAVFVSSFSSDKQGTLIVSSCPSVCLYVRRPFIIKFLVLHYFQKTPPKRLCTCNFLCIFGSLRIGGRLFSILLSGNTIDSWPGKRGFARTYSLRLIGQVYARTYSLRLIIVSVKPFRRILVRNTVVTREFYKVWYSIGIYTNRQRFSWVISEVRKVSRH